MLLHLHSFAIGLSFKFCQPWRWPMDIRIILSLPCFRTKEKWHLKCSVPFSEAHYRSESKFNTLSFRQFTMLSQYFKESCHNYFNKQLVSYYLIIIISFLLFFGHFYLIGRCIQIDECVFWESSRYVSWAFFLNLFWSIQFCSRFLCNDACMQCNDADG